MSTAATSFVILVAVLHFGFMILEMFLWRKPIGMKVFRNTAQKAETTAALAANQGLYNGFLAAGLVTGLILKDPASARAFQIFFLSCVIAAGVFGAWSVSWRIFWIQAFPGAIALTFIMGQ